MSLAWKTVRIFISSTFRDMHAERDHLIKVVFPELRERCAKRHIHLVDVDLRWGVTQEQAEMGKALEVCLHEIDSCRPFFVGILGERYGYTPPQYEVPDEPAYGWARQMEPGNSITAMEIYHGVLNNPHMHRRAFFYFRDPSFIETLPAEEQESFKAESHESAEKLRRLKACIRESGLPIKEFRKDDLESFSKQLLEDLWSAIQAEYPEDMSVPDPLDLERAYHDFFITTRTELFIGQQHLLKRLHEYAKGDSSGPMIVSGTPGSGKSALLAKFVDQFLKLNPDIPIIYHFVGASPASTDPRQMLLRLCKELAKQFNFQEEIEQDFEKLRVQFQLFLNRATENRRIILVIDAFNQLDEAYHSHDLYWLPHPLPAGLRLIVSSQEGDILEAARRGYQKRQELIVTSLRLVDQGFIVARQLGLSRKRLTTTRQWRKARLSKGPPAAVEQERSQLRFILTGAWKRGQELSEVQTAQRETANPLYLKMVTEELRLFGRFERLDKFISSFPSDVDGMFNAVLDRLERDYGKELVESALSLIVVGRHGLLESELLELLAPEGEQHLPIALWARLHRSLGFYLKPRTTLGGDEGPIDFFHRQLAKIVNIRYLSTEETQRSHHRQLAEYFRKKTDPEGDSTWTGNYHRGLSELPHHQTQGEMWDELENTLCDLAFIENKFSAGMRFDLMYDYMAAINSLPESREQRRCQEVRREAIRQFTDALVKYSRLCMDIFKLHHSVWARLKAILSKQERQTSPVPAFSWHDAIDEILQTTTVKSDQTGRARRLMAFHMFASARGHVISRFGDVPAFCLQEAYNFVAEGPVAETAARRLESQTDDSAVLLRVDFQRPSYVSEQALERVLEGHTGSVTSVCLTEDGSKCVSGSHDGTVRIWNVDTGECLHVLVGHDGGVLCTAMTPDGRIAVSGGSDGTLRVWSIQSGECLRVIECGQGWLTSVAITPDGGIVASAGGIVRKGIRSVEDYFSLRYDTRTCAVKTWDIETGVCYGQFQGLDNAADFVQLSADASKLVASAGGFGTSRRRHGSVCVWDLRTSKRVCVVENERRPQNVSISLDGGRILVGHSLLQLCNVSAVTEEELCYHRVLPFWRPDVICSSVDCRIAVVAKDDVLEVWDLDHRELMRRIEGLPFTANGVRTTVDGRRTISFDDKCICVWNTEKREHTVEFPSLDTHRRLRSEIRRLTIGPDRKTVIAATLDSFHTVEMNSGFVIESAKDFLREDAHRMVTHRHIGGYKDITFTPDGNSIITVGDNMLKRWRTQDCKYLYGFGEAQDSLGFAVRFGCVKCNLDGRMAVSGIDSMVGATSYALRIWDLETQRCIKKLDGHTEGVTAASFTPDGRVVISGSRDKSVRAWRFPSGQPLQPFVEHQGQVLCIAVHPRGRFVVSTGADQSIRVWNIATAQIVLSLLGHKGEVSGVAFSADGRRIASCGDDRTVRIWGMESEKCIAIYCADSIPLCISEAKADGQYCCGTSGEGLLFLGLKNVGLGPAIVTAVRMWKLGPKGTTGTWEDDIGYACPWCGQRFVVENQILDVITGITLHAELSPDQSPCLELPDDAWDEPQLLSECPHCRRPLKFNPFIVDDRDRY